MKIAGPRLGGAIVHAAILAGLLGCTDDIPVATDKGAMNNGSSPQLLISEVALANNNREFIEILNVGSTAVDLSDVYLSDDADYCLLPAAFGGSPTPYIGSFDFIVKFPDGATIAPGATAVVAFHYQGIQSKLGIVPDFGIQEVPTGSVGVQMVDPATMPGAISGLQLASADPQLTNGGEGIVLFTWDGTSDLVKDIDMFSAGESPSSSNQLANKSGVMVDGPDADSTPSGYQPDNYLFSEVSGDASNGFSHKRIKLETGYEHQNGTGNGVDGDDETTEDFADTWDSSSYTAPTPGAVPSSLQNACGDGVTNAGTGEECDDGGESAMCDGDCTFALCGDTTINATAGEECDDGGQSATCDDDCTLADCGDGHTNAQAGEDCDHGGESATCDSDCTVQACGDSHTNPLAGEECDDGGESATCDFDCTAASCSDGYVNATAGEECDDGNSIDSDACTNNCTVAVCGDGSVLTGVEECDDSGETATCDSDCTDALCGDLVVNSTAGEACDDGNSDNSDGCVGACQPATCGDGYVQAGVEECDGAGGNTVTCDLDCTLAVCGDGILNQMAGEVCDDSNLDDDDGCVNNCQEAVCGDGNILVGVEECDDGNQSDTDSCTSTCHSAVCGDGHVYAGIEDCDTGGASTGLCDADCTLPACGDGFTNAAAGEECDDGNSDDDDGCRNDCRSATCNDFIQNVDELDIDCGGHCGPQSCSLGQTCNVSSDCIGQLECLSGTCQIGEVLVAGLYHTCAVTGTGSVRCWGRNSFGQLGLIGHDDVGDDELPSDASDIQFGGTVTQLAAGFLHTCALIDDGTVQCWGNNSFGQLGYGHTRHIGDNEAPPSVGPLALGGTAIQLAAGAYHTCALMSDGSTICWGDNSRAQLGYYDATSSNLQMNMVGDNETPASVGTVDIGGTVRALTAGAYHTCALLSAGSVRCWGDNQHGQLGQGNTETVGDNEVPSARPALSFGASVTQISAGMEHTCVLLSGASVRCWGRNTQGQLGYGHTASIGDDEAVNTLADVALDGPAVRIATGGAHTCALSTADTIRCWGQNRFGQLGQANVATVGDDETPADLGADIDVGGSVILLSAGYGHTCVRLDTGAIRCFGNNSHGQLGHGNQLTIGDDESPASAGDVSYE